MKLTTQKMKKIPLLQVVDIAVHQLKLPQPINFDDYTNVDTGISSSEELTDGLEQTLAGEFLTEMKTNKMEMKLTMHVMTMRIVLMMIRFLP